MDGIQYEREQYVRVAMTLCTTEEDASFAYKYAEEEKEKREAVPGEEDLVDDHLHPWKEPMTTAIRSNDAGPRAPPHGHRAGTNELRLPH